MTTVLEEVTGEVDRDHVLRRLDDWEKRIRDLYGLVRGWLPEGWSAVESGSVSMHEPLMQEFGVPARRLPTLEIRSPAGSKVTLKPSYLWIVPRNGRIDLHGPRHSVIFDLAEVLERPRWIIAPAQTRQPEVSLTRDSFLQALDP